MRRGLIGVCCAAAFAQGPSLKYPPLNHVATPKIAESTLPNGLKLYLIEDRELPLIHGVVMVRAGNLFDPADKLGLAAVAGVALRTGGTAEETGEQIAARLESLGATFESRIEESYGAAAFSVLAGNIGETLRIVRDLLQAPAFRSQAIEAAKAELRSSIARRNTDPERIVSREFDSLIYGRTTPHGAVMEYEHVENIRRKDVVAFHQRYFFPGSTLLALRGDFSAEAMRAQIELLFREWSHTQPAAPPFEPSEHQAVPGIYLGVIKGLSQTAFTIGHRGGLWSDPQIAALHVAAEILGGGLTSRLAIRVRQEARAAYPIHAQWAAGHSHPGTFRIAGRIKGASITPLVRAIREEIGRMQTAEVSESELDDARQRVLNRLAFRFDGKPETLEGILTYEYYGYPDDFLARYQKAVAGVTRAHVLKATKERFNARQLVVVLAGDPVDSERSLGTLELPVTSLDLTIKQPKPVLSEAGPESLRRGQELLKLAQDAAGGVEALERIQDFTEVASIEVDPAFGGVRLKRTFRWAAPAYIRQDSEFPTGRISTFWSGKSGWIATRQGVGALNPQIKRQVEGELFRTFFRLLLSDRVPERRVIATGDGTLEISDGAANLVTVMIDGKTGLPRDMQYIHVQPNGVPAHVRETITAYTDLEGVKLPLERAIEQDGKRFGQVKVEEIRVNTGVKPAELGRWR